MAYGEKKEKIKSLEEISFSLGSREIEYVLTGIPPFDSILSDGKGIPLGKFIEITSPTSVGKSTLVLYTCLKLCAKGIGVAYLDAEQGVNELMLKSTGLEKYLFSVNNPEGLFYLFTEETYNANETIIQSVLLDDRIKLIVIDSITSLVPSKMMEGSVEDATIGVKARLDSAFLMKYKGPVAKAQKTIIFINQFRTKIDIKRPQNTRKGSAGGNAFEHYMDIRFEMSIATKMERTEKTMLGDETLVYGHEVNIWAFKNRLVRHDVKVRLPIVFGKGVSMLMLYADYLNHLGIIKQAGSYFKIDFGESASVDAINVQGRVGLYNWVRENMDFVGEYFKNNDLFYLIDESKEETDG